MAIAFNNTNTPKEGVSNVFSNAFSVTAGGTDTVAFALLFARAPGNVPALSGNVTYGGQTMTGTGSAYSTGVGSFLFDIYALANPPTGSNTLAFNGDGVTTVLEANLISLTGVHQATPFRSATAGGRQAATGGATETITVTSASGDFTLTLLSNSGSNITSTDKTSDGINNALTRTYASDHAASVGSSVSHVWTIASGSFCAQFGVSVQPAAGGFFGRPYYEVRPNNV